MHSPPTSNRGRTTMRGVSETETETETESSSKETETRPWSDLPSELLTLIALRLPIIELLRFRTICKHWYSASSTASAQIESAPNQKPWLLLQIKGSKCLLYNLSGRYYQPDIPEIDCSTTFLASLQGWLLLFKQGGSIFFLCPFSSAKITLPRFPHSQVSDHIAALSAPPTSPDCVVSVINRLDSVNLDLHLLHHGDDNWTRHTLRFHIDNFKTITCATYHNGDLYYLDTGNGALTFSVKNKTGTRYRIGDGDTGGKPEAYLPFSSTPNFFVQNVMKKLFRSAENVSITVCGTLVESDRINDFIRNENIQGSAESGNSIKYKGAWIFPRFFQIPHDQRW